MELKRNAIQNLMNWKDSEDRKPMVLKGARQVGKTWLMKEFGQSCYDNFVYFNFDEEAELNSIFEANKDPHRIIELLSMIAGEKIAPEKTLVIFDEIQECPEALNALKYFKTLYSFHCKMCHSLHCPLGYIGVLKAIDALLQDCFRYGIYCDYSAAKIPLASQKAITYRPPSLGSETQNWDPDHHEPKRQAGRKYKLELSL